MPGPNCGITRALVWPLGRPRRSRGSLLQPALNPRMGKTCPCGPHLSPGPYIQDLPYVKHPLKVLYSRNVTRLFLPLQ